MARLAYTFPVVETIALYVEVLPGYSTLPHARRHPARGLVLAFGGGVAMGHHRPDLRQPRGRLSVGLSVGDRGRAVSSTLGPDTFALTLGGGVRF